MVHRSLALRLLSRYPFTMYEMTHGYALLIREPDWFEHRMLKRLDTDVNPHIFTVGCPEVDRMVKFRDHRLRGRLIGRRFHELMAFCLLIVKMSSRFRLIRSLWSFTDLW